MRYGHAVFSALMLLVGSAPRVRGAVICVGDCDYNGQASIAELVTGVNIAEDKQLLGACPGFDPTGDGAVTIDELVGGVHNGLTGCPEARFEPSACVAPIREGQDPDNVECGTVIVPENRAHRENGARERCQPVRTRTSPEVWREPARTSVATGAQGVGRDVHDPRCATGR